MFKWIKKLKNKKSEVHRVETRLEQMKKIHTKELIVRTCLILRKWIEGLMARPLQLME